MKTYQTSPELTNGTTIAGYIDVHPRQLRKEGIGIMIDKRILEMIDCYLVPIVKDGKIGFMNSYSEVVVEPRFKYVAGQFNDADDYVCVEKGNSWGIINAKGEMVVPCRFNYTAVVEKQYAIIGEGSALDRDQKYKVVDLSSEEETIPYGEYTFIQPNGRFLEVSNGHGKGLIDVHNNIIIPLCHTWISREECGAFRVIVDEKIEDNIKKSYGLFDADGTVLIPLQECRISPLKYPNNPQVDVYDSDGHHKYLLSDLREEAAARMADDDEEEYEEDYEEYEDYDYDDYGTHFGRYAGTYAQDVAGYSDDVIDDVFEGDPDAYWNID